MSGPDANSRPSAAGSAGLAAILDPGSVAVLGASLRAGKLGHRLVEILLEHGYRGRVAPVNPKGGTIAGLPVYRSLDDVPYTCDVAIIVLPSHQVLGAFESAARHGVAGAIVITSGFSESGEEGSRLERELAALSRRTGVPFVGPNSEGVINNTTGFFGVISGGMFAKPTGAGGVSLLSHSGAYTGLVFRGCADQGVGVATVVSMGNEASVGLPAMLEHLAGDERTSVVALHLEGVRDAPGFRDAATRLAARKPLVVNQVGRTSAAATVAATHTGVLAGQGRVLRALYRQCGAVVTSDSDEFVDALAALASTPVLPGTRLGVVSFSGGIRVEFADLAVESGFTLPPLRAEVEERITALVPRHGSGRNPVDMADGLLENPLLAAECVRAMDQDPGLDAIVVLLTVTAHLGIAESLRDAIGQASKPVVVGCTAEAVSWEAVSLLRDAGLPVFTSPRRVCNALRALRDAGPMRAASTAAAPAFREPAGVHAAQDGRRHLGLAASFTLLEQRGIPVAPFRLLPGHREGDAISADGLAFPLAVKVDAPDVTHKSREGLVRLDCRTEDELASALAGLTARQRELPAGTRVDGLLLQEMVAGARAEVLVGLRRDPVVGATLVVGAGGVLVEELDDVAIGVLPLDRAGVLALLHEVRAIRRGTDRGLLHERDLRSLADVIESAAAWFLADEDAADVDLNPVLLTAGGAVVVDAVIQSAAAAR